MRIHFLHKTTKTNQQLLIIWMKKERVRVLIDWYFLLMQQFFQWYKLKVLILSV
jgi:hypothetical protein